VEVKDDKMTKICTRCKKERGPVILDNNALSIAYHLDFMEDNPKELCIDCWLKDRE